MRYTEAEMTQSVQRESGEQLRGMSLVALEAMFLTFPDAVIHTDVERRVVGCNPATADIFGWSPDELIGQSIRVIYADERDFDEQGRVRYAHGTSPSPAAYEMRYRRKDGTEFFGETFGRTVRNASDEIVGFLGIIRDITERRDTARRAEEARRLRDEFLATVSHELRTPLNAILGWSTVLRREPDLPRTVQKGVDVIHRNAHAQLRIVDDILDASRIVTGQLRVDPRPMELVGIVREAMDVVRTSAEARAIAIELDAPEPVILLADPDRVRQVAWNLLSNAVKFSSPGGRVSVRAEHESGVARLVVRDEGQGIAPEFLPFVFERFRQADGSSRRLVGGLGLGLAIVRHIVELHGGVARVESEGSGKGATFVVELPVRDGTERLHEFSWRPPRR